MRPFALQSAQCNGGFYLRPNTIIAARQDKHEPRFRTRLSDGQKGRDAGVAVRSRDIGNKVVRKMFTFLAPDDAPPRITPTG